MSALSIREPRAPASSFSTAAVLSLPLVGDALFGNVNAWLLWNLTGGVDGGHYLTDVTNASRTQLMNLISLNWDRELLEIFDIPLAMLPEIRTSSKIYGIARDELEGVAISGILGDQQAALVGQTCFCPGEAKNTYGTCCFLLMNTGTKIVQSSCGLLTTVAGIVSAMWIVAATDVYTSGSWSDIRTEQVPLPYFSFATAPLSDNFRASYCRRDRAPGMPIRFRATLASTRPGVFYSAASGPCAARAPPSIAPGQAEPCANCFHRSVMWRSKPNGTAGSG